MTAFLTFLVFGLLAGMIARLLMPGPDPMGLLGTAALGCAGSLVGGFVSNYVLGDGVTFLSTTGIVGSVLGAMALLAAGRLLGASGQDE